VTERQQKLHLFIKSKPVLAIVKQASASIQEVWMLFFLIAYFSSKSQDSTHSGRQPARLLPYISALFSLLKTSCRLKSNNKTYKGVSSIYYKYGLAAKELTQDSKPASVPRSAGSLLPVCVHSKEETSYDRLQEKSRYPLFNDQASQRGLQTVAVRSKGNAIIPPGPFTSPNTNDTTCKSVVCRL